MNKRLSIKGRITLWYALLLIVICLCSLWILTASSQRTLLNHCSETLNSATVVLLDEMEVEHGYLEIDKDIDEVPNIYATLYEGDGTLLYGRMWVEAPFAEGEMRSVTSGSNSWYIRDTHISVPTHEDVWLRVHMSANELTGIREGITRSTLLFIPLLALVALAGGYFITSHAFKPVQHMNDVASAIAGGNDLSARIPLAGDSRDELHRLGETINAMLKRLERAFQREQQFTSDAAHELRTPLNAIITQGEYALSREETDEKDEAVAQMLATASDMNGLVNHLLMLSRLEAGQLERKDEVQLDKLLAQIAEDMQPLAEERGIALRTSLVSCTLTLNRAMITRAVINLVDNAIRYGKENGQIDIALESAGKGALITVRDDGPGLTPEEQQRVFTRFWRADGSRSTPGSGIGLALVSSIAHAHGGSVQVDSAPGEGCAFRIRLPG